MRRLLPVTASLLAVACTPPPTPASDARSNEVPAVRAEPEQKTAAAEPETPPLPPLPATPLEPAADGFELLSSGTEPRDLLRFAPTAGSHQRVELTMTMTVGLRGSALPPTRQALPPFERITTAETLSVTDGRITQHLVHDSLRVAGSDPSASQALQAAVEQIDGLEQTLIFDERGQLVESRMQIPEGTSPQLAKTLETLGKAVEQVLVQLPAEPIGVGGKWKVSHPLENRGLELEQTVEFSLVSRDDRRLEFEAQISQHPRTNKFITPTQGTELDIIEFESKGASRIVYDLDAMLPTALASRLETRFTTQTTGEQAQQLSFEMILELEIAG